MGVTTLVTTALDSGNTTAAEVLLTNSSDKEFFTYHIGTTGTVSGRIEGKQQQSDPWGILYEFSNADADANGVIKQQIAEYRIVRAAYASGTGSIDSISIKT